jgi:hypothetical protein
MLILKPPYEFYWFFCNFIEIFFFHSFFIPRPLPLFWAIYFQMYSLWVFLAESLNRNITIGY